MSFFLAISLLQEESRPVLMKSRINFETLLFGVFGILSAVAFSSYFGLGFAASAPLPASSTMSIAASAPLPASRTTSLPASPSRGDLSSAHPTSATSNGNISSLPGRLTIANAGTTNSLASTNKPVNSDDWSNNIPSPPVGAPLSSYNKLLAPKPPVPFSG